MDIVDDCMIIDTSVMNTTIVSGTGVSNRHWLWGISSESPRLLLGVRRSVRCAGASSSFRGAATLHHDQTMDMNGKTVLPDLQFNVQDSKSLQGSRKTFSLRGRSEVVWERR